MKNSTTLPSHELYHPIKASIVLQTDDTTTFVFNKRYIGETSNESDAPESVAIIRTDPLVVVAMLNSNGEMLTLNKINFLTGKDSRTVPTISMINSLDTPERISNQDIMIDLINETGYVATNLTYVRTTNMPVEYNGKIFLYVATDTEQVTDKNLDYILDTYDIHSDDIDFARIAEENRPIFYSPKYLFNMEDADVITQLMAATVVAMLSKIG